MIRKTTVSSLCIAVCLVLILVANTLAQKGDGLRTSHLPLSKIAGKRLFFEKKCDTCHTLKAAKEGERMPIWQVPDLEWFAAHVAENSEVVLRQEKSRRKRRRVAREENSLLISFLDRATPAEKKQIAALPENVYNGAYFVQQSKCMNCHMIAGEGKDVGPDLTKVARKRDRAWILENLIDPKQFAPDTQMPSFRDLPESIRQQIADYLLTLR